jgi:membrane protein implicated in regulation of membrane protease activity
MDVMIWIFIAVIFIILELTTNTFFLVWFGVGSLAAAVLNYLGFDIYMQFIVFVIVSAVLILSTRRFADRITPDSSKKTTAERLIGKTAKVVRQIVDSVQILDPKAAIIIMGDFNDNPSDKAITTTLAALPYNTNSFENTKVYNLCWDGYKAEDREFGSYFHDGKWDMLDQIIVSGSLINGSLSVRGIPKTEVYHPKWISKQDKRTGEMIPKRTYVGPFFQGGVSAHFPVFFELFFKDEL